MKGFENLADRADIVVQFCKRAVPHIVLACFLVSPIALVGCAVHAYRVYDPYDGTYHYWRDGEVIYYHQWENDTHRRDQDFRKRNQDEQRQYWQWRKNHQDNDHRDRDGHDHH